MEENKWGGGKGRGELMEEVEVTVGNRGEKKGGGEREEG